MKNNKNGHLTKQKIVSCAVDLFAAKGYKETGIREIASNVGIKSASLFYHFKTKDAILEFILKDYIDFSRNQFENKVATSRLQSNPTPDGILSCLILTFPDDKKEYYLKVLKVILQEQYRNDRIRTIVYYELFLSIEEYIMSQIDYLKKINVIRHDADSVYWAEISSSLFYTFSNRMLLGVGDMSPGYSGAGMAGLLKFLFEMLFELYGVKQTEHS
jgi:AcrR family transcriptional regulator